MKGITKHLLPSNSGEDLEVMVDVHIESNASLANPEFEEVTVSEDRYTEFIQGFNNALPLFNMIVIGHDSKERVRKVEGLTFFILSNPNRVLMWMA